MDTVLVVLALIGAAFGIISLSQAATSAGNLSQAAIGVGVLIGACLLAILARMAQSSRQHYDVMRILRDGLNVPMPVHEAPTDDRWACQCGYRSPSHVFDCTRCGTARPTTR